MSPESNQRTLEKVNKYRQMNELTIKDSPLDTETWESRQ